MEGKKNKGPKYFTLDERLEIEKMLKKGLTQRAIAKILGRFQSTVSREIRVHGGMINYRAKEAHLETQQNMSLRAAKGGYSLSGKTTIKLATIEMQIKVLFELIKEIKDEITNK